MDILRGFIEHVEKKRKEVEGKQWRYTNSRGEVILVRDRMDVLLVNLNKYTAIGDLVIQPLPSVASLAWGGFKILLQVKSRMNMLDEGQVAYAFRLRPHIWRIQRWRWRAWILWSVSWAIVVSMRDCIAGVDSRLLGLSMMRW